MKETYSHRRQRKCKKINDKKGKNTDLGDRSIIKKNKKDPTLADSMMNRNLGLRGVEIIHPIYKNADHCVESPGGPPEGSLLPGARRIFLMWILAVVPLESTEAEQIILAPQKPRAGRTRQSRHITEKPIKTYKNPIKNLPKTYQKQSKLISFQQF